MIKTLRKEIKEIKWLSSKDVRRQAIFTTCVVIISGITFMLFETGIQMLISLLIK